LLSLSAGLLYAYFNINYSKIIYQPPTLDNAGKITYIDDVGVYYKYTVQKLLKKV